MSAAAKYVWRLTLADQAPGVIVAVDRYLLRIYCEAVVRYEQAAVAYAASSVLVNNRGHLTKNPLHQVVRDNAEQVRLFARELGVGPSPRAVLRMDASHPSTGIEQEIGLPPRLRVVGGGDG
jgi:P27 family predicted phage terminase small subunit